MTIVCLHCATNHHAKKQHATCPCRSAGLQHIWVSEEVYRDARDPKTGYTFAEYVVMKMNGELDD
jgi:hypothetical protein